MDDVIKGLIVMILVTHLVGNAANMVVFLKYTRSMDVEYRAMYRCMAYVLALLPFAMFVTRLVESSLVLFGYNIIQYQVYFDYFIFICFIILRSLYYKFGFGIMNISIQLDSQQQKVNSTMIRIRRMRKLSNAILAIYLVTGLLIPVTWIILTKMDL